MLNNREIVRPEWKKIIQDQKIDLTKNVHHDKILNDKIKNIIQNSNFILNYANDSKIYQSISQYYKISVENISIGFGATDLIQRVINSIKIDKLYIVTPSFMMVDVYCKMIDLDYEFINFDQIDKIEQKNNSGIYIVNPSGVNGEAVDVRPYLKNFKWVVLDEVYSDFFDKFSLLGNISSNIIIIKSLSKSLGVAGLRVGFCCGSIDLINEVQKLRMSQVTTSLASLVVPEIINMTPDVISRMKVSKIFLENKFDCKKSYANYVLFKKKNIYTERFGAKNVDGYFRMALADMNTLNEK
ncbi:aminotransferase class I/II-fold pyridoxal phosphate-dependent enzyme [Candidatus Pelagibacter sp.]|jgi:histidinol-phosphate aminotransferase|nr:aminotransferase class I/II-fold pyridoxal phosphate-dependent enzyme [Candidatus Pelagibacter sp.]|tara:strand:- start:3530 stop:4423 length:894 start_codon:yes stop_codon:yes gene_type:complete